MSSYPWKRAGQNAHLVVAAGSAYFQTACAVVLDKRLAVDACPDDERCPGCSQVSFPIEHPSLYAAAKRMVLQAGAARVYQLQRVLSISHDQAKLAVEALIASGMVEDQYHPHYKGYPVQSGRM